MYGNVGLSTPRGSGTNGYVVRNLSFIRPRKDIQIESLDEAKVNSSALANRKPNQEILDHEKKRQVELKCVAFQQKLEEAGRSEEEIEEEVNLFRQSILASIDIVKDNKNIQEYQTHHLSQAKIAENEKMMRALGINSQDYVEGAAFDRELQELKKRERISQRETEERQKRLGDLREREKKLDANRKKSEKQRNIHHERDRSSVEKDVDSKYSHRREAKDSASDSNTESDSSRDNRRKRYHASRRANKLEDSDTNESFSRKDDSRDIERYHNQKEHRMPRSPKRRQGSLTRRRNRDSSIPSSRRYRDGSLSPAPRRNRDSASFRRYRDDSNSPPRRWQRNHSPREMYKYSEKSSFRSVSPPSYAHYQDENIRSHNKHDTSGSEKRNDSRDHSPQSNYNEDISSSRRYRYSEEDKSSSHDKRRTERNNSRLNTDRVRKNSFSSEESDYHKNRRRRRDNISDSEPEKDRGKKKSRRDNDYSNSNSDSTEDERHNSKKYNSRS